MSKVVIVGGGGHVGLPLALVLADSDHEVVSLDLAKSTVDAINLGKMPFEEKGADELLLKVLQNGKFSATTNPDCVRDAEIVIVVIGTPVDEHLNPDPNAVVNAILEIQPYLQPNQLLILRSTLFPGVTSRVQKLLTSNGISIDVTFCPERILEGHALTELRQLPQIIGAYNTDSQIRASNLFITLGVKTIATLPEEAELAKLFTNTWRYIKFAAANQFWLMANEAGLDFAEIRKAITFEYPRAADLPGPGFAAGPCLFKDTMQLAAFSNNNFALGHSAMLVNEGQPLYIVEKLEEKFNLAELNVGILGMAFKGESDDTRSSLSYKLKKILEFRANKVITTDPYVRTDTSLFTLEQTIETSDILIIAAPHKIYQDLQTNKPVIDVWNLLGTGSLV